MPSQTDSLDTVLELFDCEDVKFLWIKKRQKAWEIALKSGDLANCIHGEVKCDQQKNYKFCRVMAFR